MDVCVGMKVLLLASVNVSKREYMYYSICIQLLKTKKKVKNGRKKKIL